VVRRSSIHRAGLRYGVQAQHPALLFILGVVLCGTLAWPVLRVVDFLANGGTLFGYDFYIGSLAVLGGWLVYDAVKRGWVLTLALERSTVKLAFDKGAEIEGLRKFVRHARAETGLWIEMP